METDIFLAISNNDLPQLRRLLADPATAVDALDWYGVTALCRAAQENRLDACALLVEAGAQLDVPGQRSSPAHVAATKGHTAIVALLLKRLNNPNIAIRCDPGCVCKGHCELLDRLVRIRRGCTLERWPGATPLHCAALTGCAGVLIMILAHPGVDPNVADAKGVTPLHAAALRFDPLSVQALLRAGADPCARTTSGDTALTLALTRTIYPPGHSDNRTTALLIAAGDRQWACILAPIPGLETALLSVWKTTPNELPLLFQRLTPRVQAKIRAALAALHRGNLPQDLRMELLATALNADAVYY